MQSRLPLVVAGFVAVFTLTGCTPGDNGNVGLARQEDGSLILLVRMCDGSVDTAVLDPVNSFPPSLPGEETSVTWMTIDDQKAALPASHDLNVDVALPFDEGALLPDVLYEVAAVGDGNRAGGGLFSASELSAIEPGRVLARARPESDGAYEALTPEEFEAEAAHLCSWPF